MEFLLVNHPLDCPICDQAGECDLQVGGVYTSPLTSPLLYKYMIHVFQRMHVDLVILYRPTIHALQFVH